MKFITNKADILPVIKAVGTVCESKPVNAALSSLRLNVKGDKLQVMGSDGETTIAGIVPIMRDPKEADSTRVFLVEADIIQDAVSELPEGQILFRLDDAKPNTLQIEWTGGAGKATMPITDAKDFQTPVSLPKDAPVVMIPAGQLRDALNGTVYATANDDLRPSLSGVLFEIARDVVNLVASDSHILVWHNAAVGKNTGEENHQFILHNHPAGLLKGILKGAEGDVKVSYSDKNAVFTCGSYRVTVRLIDAKYPSYRSIFPKDNDCSLVVNRASFTGALRRVSISADNKNRVVILSLNEDGKVQIKASNKDRGGSSVEKVDGVYSGKTFDIGLHSQMLQDILAKFSSEEVVIRMKEPTKAAIISPKTEEAKTYEALIMPLMIA